MAQRMLPKQLRWHIGRYDQYKWQLNRGVTEEELINELPVDLRRDIKRLLHFDACLVNLKCHFLVALITDY
ncbi:unnamed protein product [Citrullus colocynthis]|uniref:Uncharacterized protein n=1 Tax=Citrullus colocynthis TaxID=252529 RepID=A0ABP0YJD7_9ROSI